MPDNAYRSGPDSEIRGQQRAMPAGMSSAVSLRTKDSGSASEKTGSPRMALPHCTGMDRQETTLPEGCEAASRQRNRAAIRPIRTAQSALPEMAWRVGWETLQQRSAGDVSLSVSESLSSNPADSRMGAAARGAGALTTSETQRPRARERRKPAGWRMFRHA